MTRATCSLCIFTAARASRRKRCATSLMVQYSGRRNLIATRRFELQIRRGNDHPHAALPQHPIDSVLTS